jgi:glycerate kinase
MVKILDAGLAKLADAWISAGLTKDIPHSPFPVPRSPSFVEQPGDGAAGGIGACLRICLGAKMESGAMLVMRHASFLDRLEGADIVITGEGQTDGQTAGGKLCSIVAKESRNAGVPVALLSGALGGDVGNLLSTFDYAVSIACGQIGLDAMIRDSRRDLSLAAENLIRAIHIGAKLKIKLR